jgi:Cnl2/NKP2 family protein
MPPTEATLLSAFLLPPAPLPAIVTLKSFAQLFPKPQQSSPQVKALYRDLQNERARITDSVGKNIVAEVKRGNAQRRAVVKARREAEKEEQDDEIDVETAVSLVTIMPQSIMLTRNSSLDRILISQFPSHILLHRYYQSWKVQLRTWRTRSEGWMKKQKRCWKRCGTQLEDSVISGMDDWRTNNFESRCWRVWNDSRSLARRNKTWKWLMIDVVGVFDTQWNYDLITI